MNYPLNIFDRVYIIDNFYTDPDPIRAFALQQSKTDCSDGNYAGIMTQNTFLTQEHVNTFSALVGHRVIPSTSYTGKFRFSRVGDQYKQDIHFDPGDNNTAWAGVVYMTPNIEGVDGTIFWKHNRTNLESIPRTIEGLQEHGWTGPEVLKEFLDVDGVDHSLWTRTLTVPYKYNRLVLFRPWMFHSPGVAFGEDLKSARCVQTFFWSPT
jgi:hypothetical protein